MTGAIPLGTTMPAIAVSEISVMERNTVGMNAAKVLATARIQVTVQASSYADQKTVLDLVRKACPNQRGTVNGVAVDSIVPDVAGPDLDVPDAGLFMQSRDFIVKFTETT
jgi:hypothetical protein